MECFCAGANTSAPYACVRDTGSTAIACQPVPAGCSARMNGIDAQTAGVCACLSGADRSCRAANDIRNLCDCGAPPPAQPCQPAAGPASFLAGKWHAPVSPSDFSMDLMLEGGPAGICGSSTSTFAVNLFSGVFGVLPAVSLSAIASGRMPSVTFLPAKAFAG